MLDARRAVYLQVATFIIVLASFLLLSHFFPIIDFVVALQRRVLGLGAWSAICYPLLFALCNVLLLPGGILCVGSGFFFGLWWGFVVVFVGNSISAAISFAVSRWAGVRWLWRKLSRHPMLQALVPAVEREGWKFILLSQLHPFFPTSLINYFYGLTRIPFRTYMLWDSIGRAPGLFLYVYLGTLGQLGLNLVRGKSHPRLIEYWTWGGAFLITVLLFILLTRIALHAIQRSQDLLQLEKREHSMGANYLYNINKRN